MAQNSHDLTADHDPALDPARRRERSRVLTSSLAGTTIEWYEFFIYGTAAALVFSDLFFPQFDRFTGTLLSLSTFAVAFIARPAGAALFGHFGDRVGRKASLVATLVIMGTSTFLIGVLPTYDTIGVWAPLVLVILRVLQGLSLGGEYSGAVLMCVEHAGKQRRGLFGAIVNTGSGLGLILANLVFIASSGVSGDGFVSWGWRLPFLVSAVLVIIALVIRLRVEESPEFAAMRASKELRRMPLVDTLKGHLRPVVLCAIAYLAAGVTFYMAAVYALNYIQDQLDLSRNIALAVVLLGFSLIVIGMPFFGWLSDRYDRKTILQFGAAGMIVTPFIWFPLLGTRSFWLMLVAFVVLFFPFNANYGVMPTFFARVFPTGVRYTGMAVGYNIGTVLSAGVAPIIATSLLEFAGHWYAIALYMSLSAVLSLVAGVFLVELKDDQPGQPAMAPRQPEAAQI